MLLKKLVNLTLSESRAVTNFLEEWQGTLEEAAIAGLAFTEKQQIVLLLSALPQSWRAFMTTQGSIQNQTLVNFISNMLQEEAMTASDQSPEKSTAFFTRNKSPRKPLYNPRHLQEQSIPTSSMVKPRTSFVITVVNQDINGPIVERKHEMKRQAYLRLETPPQSNKFQAHKSQANLASTTTEEPLHLFSVTSNNNQDFQETWYFDSGATQYMSPRRDWFTTFETLKIIYMADDGQHQAVRIGSFTIQINGSGQVILIKDVLYVPASAKNLLSVSQITAKSNSSVRFTSSLCIITTTTNIGQNFVIKCTKVGNLYPLGVGLLNIPQTAKTSLSAFSLTKDTATIKWHHRLGHLNLQSLQQMQKQNLVMGLPDKLSVSSSICEGCVLGKHQVYSFPDKSLSRATSPLDLVHTDLGGPMQTQSLGGATYYITCIDDFSQYTKVYFLKRKFDAFITFQKYKALVENQIGRKIKVLRSDNGGEYKSLDYQKFCDFHGIQLHFTNPYTPQQNGVAERKNRTLVESARSMLQTAKLPNSFWGEAIATACYLQNRSYSKSIPSKTLYEVRTGNKPDISHLRVFGCRAYVHIPDEKRKKLEPKSMKCLFIGYAELEGVKRI